MLDKNKKLVICCSRGKYSQEVVPGLIEKGFDAVSLKGGYIAWLMDLMREDHEKDISADVEKSIRKKFRKSIWCKFTKAINQYELVKEGDCIAVCISGGKDSMLMAKLFQELKLHNKFSFDVKTECADHDLRIRYFRGSLSCGSVSVLSVCENEKRSSLSLCTGTWL